MSNRAIPDTLRPARPRLPAEARQTSLPYLMSLLTHDDPLTRRRAAAALGRAEDPLALDSLIMALHDGDRLVQQSAIGALGAIGDARAIPPLRQLHPLVDRRLQAAIEEAQRDIAAGRTEGRFPF